MILGDKIINLRKKNGWSQEEFAEKMNVSRQSVSKWEGAQSVPELEKILIMSDIFGVTVDYLLKDEIEDIEYSNTAEEEKTVRKVSLEEANSYLSLCNIFSSRIAAGVGLCIISPVCLILLGALSEVEGYGISEDVAAAIGIIVLLILIAVAVADFIYCGVKLEKYEFLEKEIIETEYGVSGMVKERQKAFHDRYIKGNITGVILCILSPVPLFAAVFTGSDLFAAVMVCILLLMIAAGVVNFIAVGVKWSAMQKLLQEGDFTPDKKRKSKLNGAVSAVYWLVTVAIFLGASFYTGGWGRTWVIWPVAGVLFAAVMVVCDSIQDKEK